MKERLSLPYSPKYTPREFDRATEEIAAYTYGRDAINELAGWGNETGSSAVYKSITLEDISQMGFPEVDETIDFPHFWNEYLFVYVRAASRLIKDGGASAKDLRSAQRKTLGAVVWWERRSAELDVFESDAFNTFRSTASSFLWEENPDSLPHIASSTRRIGTALQFFAEPRL